MILYETSTITIADKQGGHGEATDLYPPTPELLPEPLLWKIFEDLVIACRVLEKGDIEAGGAAWDLIVHRDIKLENGEWMNE